MRRIDTQTAVNNRFVDRDDVSGVPGTNFNAAFCNAIQEEIAGAVEGAGYSLDPQDNGQLLKAMKKLGVVTFFGQSSVDLSSCTSSFAVVVCTNSTSSSPKITINNASDVPLMCFHQTGKLMTVVYNGQNYTVAAGGILFKSYSKVSVICGNEANERAAADQELLQKITAEVHELDDGDSFQASMHAGEDEHLFVGRKYIFIVKSGTATVKYLNYLGNMITHELHGGTLVLTCVNSTSKLFME